MNREAITDSIIEFLKENSTVKINVPQKDTENYIEERRKELRRMTKNKLADAIIKMEFVILGFHEKNMKLIKTPNEKKIVGV